MAEDWGERWGGEGRWWSASERDEGDPEDTGN
jgi:hypothetical protein